MSLLFHPTKSPFPPPPCQNKIQQTYAYFNPFLLLFQTFTCTKGDNCPIDLYRRRCCKKCRLVKCFAIGMSKGRRQTAKSRLEKAAVSLISEPNSSPVLRSILQSSPEGAEKNSLPHAVPLKSGCQSLRLPAKFALSPVECALMGELESALRVFPDEQSLPLPGKLGQIIQSVDWPSVYGRRIVAFCKQVSPFKVLPQADQLQMLKFFYMPMVMLRLAFRWSEVATGQSSLALVG